TWRRSSGSFNSRASSKARLLSIGGRPCNYLTYTRNSQLAFQAVILDKVMVDNLLSRSGLRRWLDGGCVIHKVHTTEPLLFETLLHVRHCGHCRSVGPAAGTG